MNPDRTLESYLDEFLGIVYGDEELSDEQEYAMEQAFYAGAVSAFNIFIHHLNKSKSADGCIQGVKRLERELAVHSAKLVQQLRELQEEALRVSETEEDRSGE